MLKARLEKFRAGIQARTLNERVLLLAGLLAVLGYLWLVLGPDPLSAALQDAGRRISTVEAQIAEQQARYQAMQASYRDDPDAFVRGLLSTLQQETLEVDARLEQLYGRLISPREMSQVLTSILQKESGLRLVSLENTAPLSLFRSELSPVPLVGPAPALGASPDGGLEVYRHGIRMVLEGGYLDTVRFLQSLEELDSNFFWEGMSFSVREYPDGREISLEIFTLSTQQEWLGV